MIKNANLYYKKTDDLNKYVQEYSKLTYEINKKEGYYNNLLLDSLIVVKRLEKFTNCKYYISNTIMYDTIKNNFIYLIKNILILHSNFDYNAHFPFYIFYHVEYDQFDDSYILIFECRDDDLSEILFNNHYILL